MALLFESPAGLIGVGALAAALAAGLLLTLGRARRRQQRLMGPGAGFASFVPDLMLVVATAALGLALCGPLLGRRAVQIDGRGIDLVFAMDASRSMNATDTPPSRARRARAMASDVLAALEPGDRVGLVAFAGRGMRLAPLTPDRDVLVEWLTRIDSRTVLPQGSKLAAGISSALSVFDLEQERRRVILLVGDGEWSAAAAADLGSLALRQGVHVFSALVGTDTGAPIPDHGVPLIAENGQPALTRRMTKHARALAEATDGEVFLADRWGRIDTAALTAALRRAPAADPEPSYTEWRRAPSPWPLAALAFVLLVLEGPVRDRRTWAPSTPRTRRTVLVSILALSLVGAGTPTGDPADIASAWLRAGAQAVKQGQDAEARRAFEDAAATALDPSLAGTAHYQLGVWHLKHDDPASARIALLESLRLHPGQRDAVFNLEWAQLAVAARALAEKAAEPATGLLDERPEGAADETSTPPEADPGDTSSHDFPRTQAPLERPSSQTRPKREGGQTPGPNLEAGANGRALPDPEALSWWLDLVEDDPTRGQRDATARRHGPGPSGPPW